MRENTFVSPYPDDVNGQPQQPQERIKRADVVAHGNRLWDAWDRQQKDAAKAIQGTVMPADGGRHSSTSTAAELAERRRTEAMYARWIVAMLVAAFVNLAYVVHSIVTRPETAVTGLLFWVSLLTFAGLCVGVVFMERLRQDTLRHTPEGLRHVELDNAHELDRIRTLAEARRHDAGTALAQAHAALLLAEARTGHAETPVQPPQQPPVPAVVDRSAQVHHTNLKAELMHYVIDPDNYDDTGRFDSSAPWAKRSGRSTGDREAMLAIIEAVNAANEFPLFVQKKGQGWTLNVQQYRNMRQVHAAFTLVD